MTSTNPRGAAKPALVLGVLIAVVVGAVIAFAVFRPGAAEHAGDQGGAPTQTLPDTDTDTGDPALDTVLDPALDAVLSGEEPERTGGLLSDAMSGSRSGSGTGAGTGAGSNQSAADTNPSTTTPADTTGGAPSDSTTDTNSDGAVASAAGSLPAGSFAGASAADRAIDRADELAEDGKLVDARRELARVLADDSTPPRQLERVRARIRDLNDVLVFSDRVVPGDPMTEEYRVQSGDSLSRIASRRELLTHWKLIARLNGIAEPSKIRVGQRLKLVRGPFHAIVDKSAFRMDVYFGSPDTPRDWVYVTSMPVGLGQDDGTPVGSFVVSPGKVENPGWVNPRDHTEQYHRDDPSNPIGEFWIGLTGLGESAQHTGYGIHGTIDPASIGRTESLGCVRLGDDDVALAYELLTEGVSVVHIVE